MTKREYWREHYKHLTYYPDRLCKCGCGGQIPTRTYHEWKTIPQYIIGHHRPTLGKKHKIGSPRKGKNWDEFFGKTRSDEIKQKMSQARAFKFRSEVDVERRRTTIVPGPHWWKTFRDFVLVACHLYDMQYMKASVRIRRILAAHDLARIDIILFINFVAGHNQWELAERYDIDVKEVRARLANIERIFPGVFQRSKLAPDILYAYRLESWWFQGEVLKMF